MVIHAPAVNLATSITPRASAVLTAPFLTRIMSGASS